ncbi:Enoyl-CoA hydratase/isomerase [Caldalkalibacillus thermarum TA2.A1]|uniref:Enoyl-CoA hydratase n=1 Tax=Caldalkalibacillus thermarum (strain TA2.A1) TaxID=986075 RepID=F5L3H1_CALTT|nr:enoyl-CoA hydratase [Caldalkalibacillus thermarum]EGL84116.1 Enoyl-CoA hydratase/isomerase [Caldalkalibacillus thermarum TA2.A1]QZT33622.1 enoyl-CoA hydratase [Caldalkalibacillus thermarum TA2.A1]
MAYQYLSLSRQDRVAVVTLNRPPANALSPELLQELDRVLTEIEQDSSLKVVVVHGEGRFFAAGADIKGFTAISSAEEAERLAREGQQIFNRMEAFPKPVIAAIHGAALGGGLELALACHIRLATPDAKLGLPELNLGIIPGFAGTQRLPRIVGKGKSLEMILTSQPVSGEEAETLGLVNKCVSQDDLLNEALGLAKQIAEKSAVSVAYSLEAVNYGEQHGLTEGQQKEAELFGRVFTTEDAKEGVQAFLEKRKPVFKDR